MYFGHGVYIYVLYIYWNRPFFIAEVPAETRDLVRWCQEKGIVVTAYGSLGTEWGTEKWHLYTWNVTLLGTCSN